MSLEELAVPSPAPRFLHRDAGAWAIVRPITKLAPFRNRLAIWFLPQAPAKDSPFNPGRRSDPLLLKPGVSSVAERGIPASFSQATPFSPSDLLNNVPGGAPKKANS